MTVDWTEVVALATVFSGLALVISALLILAQIRHQAEEQFVSGTAVTFEIWVDDDFQRAVQWILHDLSERSWAAFVGKHRRDYGERAFIRVGSYFNRVGYLVTHHLLGNEDRLLLDNLAGVAIAVWQKIEPLVLEARLIENSTLFRDFEAMLPECYECYVPTSPVPSRVRAGAQTAANLPGRS